MSKIERNHRGFRDTLIRRRQEHGTGPIAVSGDVAFDGDVPLLALNVSAAVAEFVIALPEVSLCN